MRRLAIGAAAVLVTAALATLAMGRPVTGAPKCPVFPPDNPWNTRVDALPAAPNSDAVIAAIGPSDTVHADFGAGLYEGAPIGIPYKVVSKKQKGVPVRFEFAGESDRGKYPLPRNVPIEGGRRSDGDRHVILVDKDACRLHELYAAYPERGGRRWRAGSGARWNLRSNRLRAKGKTSGDAAGLPILPGLARHEELAAGGIDHALRFTVERTRNAYVYPARHAASDSNDPNLPPMGMRFRLRASFDTSGFGPQARSILETLKAYGMHLADNGSNWFISGAPSARWNNDDLAGLSRVRGSDFEVVDTSSLPRPGE